MANSTKITLKVIRKVYKSGTPYYHLTGRIFGQPHQENFPTQDKAEAKKVELIRVATQGQSAAPTTRMVSTIFPTDLELHAAEVAYSRLKAALPDVSLTTVVDFYLQENAVAVAPISTDLAVEKFNARRLSRGNQEKTTAVTGTVLRKFIGQKLAKEGQPAPRLKIKMTDQITKADVEAFVFDESVAKRTRRDRYDLLHNFFAFLLREKHMRKNLVYEIDRPKCEKEGSPTIFAIEQCQALLDAAATEPGGEDYPVQGAMLPYFASALKSGLRPDEGKRLLPDWSNVVFENGIIMGFRSKAGGIRHVTMHDALPEILMKCKAAGLKAGYFDRGTFERIQEKAGVRIPVIKDDGETEVESFWDNDILRHCYASYFWARKDNPKFPLLDENGVLQHGTEVGPPQQHKVGFLIENMGNSERVLKQSYINGSVVPADGAAFFKMQPANMEGLGAVVVRTRAKAKGPNSAMTAATPAIGPATTEPVAAGAIPPAL